MSASERSEKRRKKTAFFKLLPTTKTLVQHLWYRIEHHVQKNLDKYVPSGEEHDCQEASVHVGGCAQTGVLIGLLLGGVLIGLLFINTRGRVY